MLVSEYPDLSLGPGDDPPGLMILWDSREVFVLLLLQDPEDIFRTNVCACSSHPSNGPVSWLKPRGVLLTWHCVFVTRELSSARAIPSRPELVGLQIKSSVALHYWIC